MDLEFEKFVPMLVGLPAGRVFGDFYELVKDAIKKARAFKPELEEIERILKSLKPLVDEIDRYNGEFDRPPEEASYLIRKMEEGKELVVECLKVHKFNYYKKQSCTDNLRKFGKSLKSYLQVDVQLQQSRDIKEILFEIKLIGLRLNGQTSGVVRSDAPRVYRALCVPFSVPENPVGLDVPLKGLKMELFKDGVSVLILSAPPGCGKTSLAALLYYDEEVKERFKDNIFFITVSQKPSLQLIVQRIFQHKNYEMPAFLGDDALDDMVSQLRNFVQDMNPKPLFILDDVWPESEFVLKKLDFRIPGYKVLVTSRYTFSNYSATFPLDPLDEKDAMTLFCKLAFQPGQSPDVPKEVLNNIVKACKRFPIALITVAGSLRGESAETWEIRASELSENGSIFEQDDVLACLKKSLDALGNKYSMNECLMDLCAFPEDLRIPVTTLIDMWVELYKLDEKKFVVNLQNLAKRNLLDMVITRKDTSGSYTWHFVTQHDLLRELAIHESNLHSMEERERLIVEINANNFPYWWREQKVISSHLLSISTDENFSSTWCNIQAPEVEVVVLNLQSNLQSNSCDLPDFLANMDKLKVLLVANYGYLPVKISNFTPLGSLSNLKRIRLERVSIPSGGFTSVKLQNLQKITLVTCNIDQAFCDSNFNLSESMPNLVEMVIHCCYDLVTLPREICQLDKLQKLSITDCHYLEALPEEIGNLEKLKALRLGSCIALSRLPDSITTLQCLRVIDLSGCSDIERLPDDLGKVSNLQTLHMIGCSKIQELPGTIKDLEHLEEVICDEEANFLWHRFIRSMQKKPEIKVCKEESTLDFLEF